ncbi:MAG TPA: aminotransferase class V-fold PLP-dependent enzyme, partial [Candidatus Limnocylindrales bacterium]|nr:aminotransferase class V-fold PLP-dependent enzyme [Candidatus Limnocylindrales bacterium]
TADEPATTADEPATTADETATTADEPATTADEPATTAEPDVRRLAPERPFGRPDVARTDALTEAITSLLPALDEFNRFDGPDLTVPRSAWLPLIDEPLPEHGVGAEAVLETLREVVIRRGLRTGHPGFTSWVTTSPTTVATAAHLAQAVASSQRWWLQPGNHIDSMAVRWILELLGFPPTFVGTFTAGGSTANLVGLGAARQHAGEKLGIDPAADGIEAIPAPRVYASAETHHVVTRAMGVLGIGRTSIRLVDLDAGRRADLRQLRALIAEDLAAGRTPVAIVGNAGDVNTGIIDPLPEMAAIAHEHDIWFHVDGAYGGWGMLDPRVEEAYGDRSIYDSFAVDPHKWLAAPVGTGLAVCRDGELLSRAFTIEPGHYDRERRDTVDDGNDPPSPWAMLGSGTADWGVDFSTPARGIAVWAVLKEIGAEGMRERVRRHNDFARIVASRARQEAELELLAEPQLSVCCFRYRPAGWHDPEMLDQLNADILAELRREGRSLPSSTRVNDAYAIRACYINPRNDREHVDLLVDDVLRIGRDLALTQAS